MKIKQKPPYFSIKSFLHSACFLIYSTSALTTPLNHHWFIQVGAYKNKQNAENMLRSLKERTPFKARVIYHSRGFYVVQVGSYANENSANQALIQLKKMSFFGFLVVDDATKKTIQPKYIERKKSTKGRQVTEVSFKEKEIASPPPPPPLTFKTLSQREVFPVFPTMDTLFYGFPYASRGIGEGTWGQQTNFGNGDFMLPLLGNNDWIAYLDGAAKYGDDKAWFGSIGGGVRSAFGNHIWGAYFFTDENESSGHKIFWFGNPGVEYMSPTLDIHFNGYIPLSSKTQSFGNFFASSLGLPGVAIVNRTLYDAVYDVENIAGPGIDGEIGYTFQNYYSLRPFIGGYHFFSLPNGTHINGVEGGIQIPIGNHIQLLIHDAYDPVQKNTAMGTLRILMGGVAKNQFGNVRDRMMDPIERHLGAYQTGAGVPILSYNRFVRTASIYDNIWFFSPTGSAFSGFSSCTASNPCIFNQTSIDGINAISPLANFFIAPGTYNNPAVGSGFSIRNGQNLHGRTSTWLQPASGSNRGLLNDTLQLFGNNLISNLQINGLSNIAGIESTITVPSNVTTPIIIQNSSLLWANAGAGNIGVINNQGQDVFRLINSEILFNGSNAASYNGILNDTGTLIVSNLNLNMSISGGGLAVGIQTNGPTFIENSNLNVYNTQTTAFTYGIRNLASLFIKNSNLLVSSNSTSSSFGIVALSSLSYANSKIAVITKGSATATAVSNASSVTNLGGMTCITIQNGVVTRTDCPP